MRRDVLMALSAVALTACAASGDGESANLAPYVGKAGQDVTVASLASLSVEALRTRPYGSTLKIEEQIGGRAGGNDYADAYGGTGSGPYDTFLASYDSDALGLYTRVDIPNGPMPANGYPVVIFCHGWIGIEAAPSFHFSHTPKSMYAELIDAYVDAGFVVLTPGYRGHGTVNGVPADGIEYMAAWDNGSYLSPIFYAIDVLNLLDGVHSLEAIDWSLWRPHDAPVKLDLTKISISGHSQGGDVVLNVLAIAGEGSAVKNVVARGSISDGTFPDRFTQAETYEPMQKTAEAFMSGDGTWTGTAVGKDGSVNPNFIFGYPSDWIGIMNRADWTWQNETWSAATVAEALAPQYREMYETLNKLVGDIDDAEFTIEQAPGKRVEVRHDDNVAEAMAALGAFRAERYLKEPLILHYSDQDMYSLPAWNEGLCGRINKDGGACQPFLYPKNNHLMRKSEHRWFSDEATVESYDYIESRDIAHFRGEDAASVRYP